MFKTRQKGHHIPRLTEPQMVLSDQFEKYLNQKPNDENGVLYFHIPFCDNICSFCNLNRVKINDEIQAYTNFLIQSIKYYSKFEYIQNKIFKSIYFGGGTPTILKNVQIEQLFKAINENFRIAKDVEFSSESTLHNLSISKLNLMKSLGVNRYSFGVQTFSDNGRKILNRKGSCESAIKKLENIRENFDGLVCADIIYNYPNQTIYEVKNDAKILKELKIDSVSFYSLQFHKGSKFFKKFNSDYYDLSYDLALHDAFIDEMLDENYEILEYTKLNRKNRDRYLYIKLSNQGVDILPIGNGAAGRIGKYSIMTDSGKNMIFKNSQNSIEFSNFAKLFQYPKINLSDISKFLDEEFFKKEMDFFKKCENLGYVEITKDEIIFNKSGIFWGNTIALNVINISKEYFLKKGEK